MMRILIHVHVYYKEMWSELQDCLANVMNDNLCDLYVTMVENHKDLADTIKSFYQNANIEIVENKGFDIAPFIHVINKVNLDNYDLLVKLHTKRNIPISSFRFNGFYLGGKKWRECLLGFCKTQENWKKSIDLLKRDDISMISKYQLLTNADVSVETDLLSNLEKRLGLEHIPNQTFVSGTMFVCKANIFKPLQNKICVDEFKPTSRDGKDRLPFLCEVLFGCLNRNSRIVSYDGKNGRMEKFLTAVSSFLYRHKITDTKESIKILGIPVYKKKIK